MSAEKRCSKCGRPGRFGRDRSKPDGLHPRCSRCRTAYQKDPETRIRANAWHRAWYAKHPGKHRESRLQHVYGLTLDGYESLLVEQGGGCRICRQPETVTRAGHVLALTVDHDHACCSGPRSCGRCIRGLICHRCNRAIGLFRDDPELLEAAAAYLRGA